MFDFTILYIHFIFHKKLSFKFRICSHKNRYFSFICCICSPNILQWIGFRVNKICWLRDFASSSWKLIHAQCISMALLCVIGWYKYNHSWKTIHANIHGVLISKTKYQDQHLSIHTLVLLASPDWNWQKN